MAAIFSLFVCLTFCVLFLSSTIVCADLAHKSPHEHRGVVLVDSFTFPKLVPSKEHDLVLLVANKKQIGDYGTDSMRDDYFAFTDFVQTKGDADQVLFAQMLVNGAENARLAIKMGMKQNFLHPRLFVFPANSTERIAYPDTAPFHFYHLLRFALQNTNLQYDIPGTLPEYKNIVKSVVDLLYSGDDDEDEEVESEKQESNVDKDEIIGHLPPKQSDSLVANAQLKELLNQAKALHVQIEAVELKRKQEAAENAAAEAAAAADVTATSAKEPPKADTTTSSASTTMKNKDKKKDAQVEPHSSSERSQYYISVIENILIHGRDYITKEINNVDHLMDTKKLSKSTKSKLRYQINILHSFTDATEELIRLDAKNKAKAEADNKKFQEKREQESHSEF